MLAEFQVWPVNPSSVHKHTQKEAASSESFEVCNESKDKQLSRTEFGQILGGLLKRKIGD
jgi:hypothetical protein